MKSKPFSYILLAMLFLNYAVLIINTSGLLSETKESEINNSLLDDERETVRNNKGMRKSCITQKTPFSEILHTGERTLTSHTPPSTPPTGYLEDYVDAITDHYTPSDNGNIDDWTQMQVADGTYSNLLEYAPETDWHSPSDYINNNGWYQVSYMYTSGDLRARCNNNGENVILTDFDIPDLSRCTISGIEVQVECYDTGSGNIIIKLFYDNRQSEAPTSYQIYPSAVEEYLGVGGPDETWGRNWTGDDLSNTNFGVQLIGYPGGMNVIYVDHLRVKIYISNDYIFDREFSFIGAPSYELDQELAIKTGLISNESLNVDIWNTSSSTWTNIMIITDNDDNTWKNVSITPYMSSKDLYFRFYDNMSEIAVYNNTWQIDAVLIKFKLLSAHFLYRQNMTLDHTQVAATLTNFPVLIDLYDRGLHDHAQINSKDILFAQPSGMKLAHELETFNSTYNSTHVHLVAWVKVPSLSSTTDTVISMYYGNRTTIKNPEHPGDTWENNFGGVWHLNEIVTDEVSTINAHNDSTSNKCHGNQDGNDDRSGLVGKGQIFDGTDDLINLTADKNLDPSADATISGWFRLANTHSSASDTSLLIMEKFLNSINNMHILLVGTDYDKAEVSDGALVFKLEIDSTQMYKWTQQTIWAADTWYYFACTLDVDNPLNNKIYINGIDDTSSTYSGSATNLNLAYNADWGIGGGIIEQAPGETWFSGVIDEMRVITTIRTAAWIATEYNNQNNSTSFYSIGIEEHMEDLDPPEIVAFGVHDPGDGQPEFWAQVIDDFSGVANVNITLNGTKYEMNVNGSGYWIYQPPLLNFNDSFSYFVNSSDFEGHFISSTVKDVRFDKDTAIPTVDQWKYFPEIGTYGTFNANITETWGIIDTVIVNVTKMNGSPTALSALMRATPSGYINDTIDSLERGIIEFVIIVNDTGSNTITSTAHIGYVGDNIKPKATDLTLIPDPVLSNQTLRLRYNYSDANSDIQAGTAVRWYQNGNLVPELNETIYAGLGVTFTAEVPSSYLLKGDQWYATITPKDWKDFGLLETSNSVTILNSQPVVSNIRFIFEHVKITPVDDNRDFVLEDEPLTLTYSFFDVDPTDSDESTIKWYLNNEIQSQYTNWTTIPASITIPSEVWQAEIIPHDGEEASAPIFTKQMTIESRPDIHGHGFKPHSTAEGVYDIWIQAGDELRAIDEVKYNITVNGLVVGGLAYNYRESVYSANGTGHWILERFDLLEIIRNLPDSFEAQFINLLNTTLTVKVSVLSKVTYESTEYIIERALQFDFTLTDAAPPRVINAGVEWAEPNPTNMTFWATLSEYGLGIDEVLLYYEFSSVSAQTKTVDLSHGPLLMVFNGTHYVVTVAFNPDQSYIILFQLSVSDLAGNINPNAYPEGMIADRIQFILPSSTDLGPFLVLFVVAIAIIGITAVVAVRKFRKTEIIGLDIDKIIEISQQVPKEKIKRAITGHTLGIIISLFDQLHGPIPIYVEPSLLRDNFDKLIELSDRAFSAVRFVDDFEREIFTAFEFDFEVLTTSISYGFSLERPEARGGAENISLNIVIHKPYDALIAKFADAYTDYVHQIHMLMNQGTAEKEKITKLVGTIRETITAIILAYEELYGSMEEFELDKQEADISL
ncbi:MAG: LamG-like jellyroll fold domain-containing protein [Candidatus Hermodarchaeota archaeon]